MSATPNDRLLDGLAMALLGSGGTSLAHGFVSDSARTGGVRPEMVGYRLRGRCSLYQPDRADERVVLFPDGSSAYVHADGLVTPMGADIRDEVGQWKLLSGPGPL